MEGAAPDPTSVWLPEPLTQERAPDAPPLAESQLGDQTTWGQPCSHDVPRPVAWPAANHTPKVFAERTPVVIDAKMIEQLHYLVLQVDGTWPW